MKLSRLALAAALAPSLALAAQSEEAHEIPPLLITRATPLQNPAPASVKVISRQQIDASAASSLVDVLRSQAGLQIRDTLGDGNKVAISLRGFGENAVNNSLVLVDGRRLNNPSLEAPDLNSVPLGNIERIEILRGSGSVLYGDQAVGGVINIVTRRPQANEAYVETSRGSHDLEAYRGHVYRQLGAGFSLYANGETRQADGYRDHNHAGYDNAFARLRHDHEGGWLLAEYQSIDDELQLPGALSEAQRRADRKASFKPLDFNDSKTQVNRLAAQQALGAHWTADFDYSHSDRDAVGYLSGAFDQGTRTETLSPRLTAHWDSALGRSEWLFGHDHVSSDYQLISAFGATRVRQTQRDWYSQLTQPLGHDLSLTLGYRQSEAEDRNQSLGKRHSDREGSTSLGLGWRPNRATRLFIKREEVLRWANVDENGVVAPGVEFLEPQTGVSWETGVEWHDSRQRYQLSLYRLDLKNELMFDPLATGPFSNDPFFPFDGANINLDQTRRQGLLLEGQRQFSQRLSLNGQYSFTDSEYLDGNFAGNEVPWVARHTASLSLNYLLLTGLTGFVEANYTGPRFVSSDNAHALPREGGYSLFNAGLRYQYQGFESKLRLNNLTGKRYDSFVTFSDFIAGNRGLYPAPEEEVQLSLGYHF